MSTTKRGRAVWALAAAALVVAGLAAAAYAEPHDPWKLMPESASDEADTIDELTYLILWITGITFVLVQALLVVFLFKYKAKPGQKAKYTHGNHAVELVWTVTPALILVFLALYQMSLWLELKANVPERNENPVEIEILAKQFEWNARYAGPDKQFGTGDDRITTAAFVVPVDRPVNATMRSLDVIHSFYLPNFRFKQDAVPGLSIKFWFRPRKLSADRQPLLVRDADALKRGEEKWVEKKIPYWEIVCAELCGITHTAMGGQLYVVSDADFAKWQANPASVPGLPSWSVWNKDNPLQAQDQVWLRWAWQDKTFDQTPDPVTGAPRKRLVMNKAKLNREPFGEDEKPKSTQEDF